MSVVRQAYQTELETLEHDLLDMASRAEHMVLQAVDALCRQDGPLAMSVILMDDEVDRRDLQIESRCLRMLALQHPMASDLRLVGTTMKVITDVERVGDLAVDIAKIAMKVEKEFADPNFIDIPKMGAKARAMFRTAIEAYVRRDLGSMNEIANMEEEVDGLYRELRGQIFENMRNSPAQVVADGWLLLAIHHLERIADHSMNIAERVYFMLTSEAKHFSRKPI